MQEIAGRLVPRVYQTHRRQDLHDYLIAAVEASGGRVVYASPPDRAPIYLGIQLATDERIGMLTYPFRVTRNRIRNRPDDEIRGQLRFGGEGTWGDEHRIWRDVAGVDASLILGIDLEDDVIVGLDSNLWDPLPMGNSFYLKEDEVEAARQTGWYVWEKENRGGTRRAEPRSPTGLETLVAFTPDRIIDYYRLERRSLLLGLDSPLRYSAALSLRNSANAVQRTGRHVLEHQFQLTSDQILDIIGGRNRLEVAVRGGVAEFHLEQQLKSAPGVRSVERLDFDAMHDFNVVLETGEMLRVECKNASPKITADGHYRVEVQKTRASKGDPASRFYSVDAFDVVAACLFSPTGRWDFRFGRTGSMTTHAIFPDRLAAIQVIPDWWVHEIADV